ncbi:hypothetical protein BJV77DRAFT_47481 [Russula vinacea]|nr:hypothetical protein BJV77DRAFT_47481 [Russula vinacea]
MHPANWERGFQSFNEVNLWVMTRQQCYAGEVILPLQESYENPPLRVSCFEGCSPAHVSKQRKVTSRIFRFIVSSHFMCARGRHFHYLCSLFQIGDGHLRTACIGHRASGTVHRTTLFLFLTLGTMTLGFDLGGLSTTHRVLHSLDKRLRVAQLACGIDLHSSTRRVWPAITCTGDVQGGFPCRWKWDGVLIPVVLSA